MRILLTESKTGSQFSILMTAQKKRSDWLTFPNLFHKAIWYLSVTVNTVKILKKQKSVKTN